MGNRCQHHVKIGECLLCNFTQQYLRQLDKDSMTKVIRQKALNDAADMAEACLLNGVTTLSAKEVGDAIRNLDEPRFRGRR